MIRIECGKLYYNTQVYFAKNFVTHLPNDDKEWAKAYHAWIKDQGAIIHRYTYSKSKSYRTALGVDPENDCFAFENDSDATIFILRWS